MRNALLSIAALLLACATSASADVRLLHADGTALRDWHGTAVCLRGVNVGGWLLMEPWMCPVDATIKDEYTARAVLAKRFGDGTAERLMGAYEDAWITPGDLDKIKALGLNAVRVPFWYRTVESEGGAWRPDAFRRLTWIVEQAGGRGMYVVLDLHGVPGGQNNADNSGRERKGKLHPTFWTDTADQRRAAEIWRRVAGHFRGNATVAAYDLLNEPIAVPSREALWAEYDALYRAVRSADPDHVITVEACRGSWSWDELPPPARFGWANVLYQTHEYEWDWNNLDKQRAAVARQVEMFHQHAAWDVPGYVGEFNPMARPAAWADAIRSYDAAGLSWTTWTYKSAHGTGNDSWGAYNVRSPRPAVPDLERDSADAIAAKWAGWTTDAAFAANPLVAGALSPTTAAAADPSWAAGVDVSALPSLEAAGAVYHDADGRTGDPLLILKRHGVNLVRLRLFVNPSHDFNKTLGAIQDLPTIVKLARRVKGDGLLFLLDLHYSDTWADGGNQRTPAAWAHLAPTELDAKVQSYTAGVLRQLTVAGGRPDWVAVGNEITAGMLWPTGHLDKTDASWDRLAGLVAAGVRGVRAADPRAKVMVHISSGGKAGVPPWFYDQLDRHQVDYDLVGVSFYPTWHDDINALRRNLAALADRGKDVVVAEVSYPYRGDAPTPQCQWPTTPAGQAACLTQVTAALRDLPGGHGKGVIWWYPEAIPVAGMNVWEGGRQGLFDEQGNVLPAADRLR